MDCSTEREHDLPNYKKTRDLTLADPFLVFLETLEAL